MFDIRLLGPGEVYYRDKAISGFPVQQHCLLFYYLVLNRKTIHTREQIATVFWGDNSPPLARKNLRNALWRLSQSFRSAGASLDDLINIQGNTIFFEEEKEYGLDINQFETALRFVSDKVNQELSHEQVALLETAVDLYRGDLLEGIYEDWCLYERERLRLAFINILLKLMNHHGNKGSYERGLEYGQRILMLEPARERVHRQMMIIHWLAGDRESALLQYRSCCEVLQAELGLNPMQETRHLYETILRSSSRPEGKMSDGSEKIEDNLKVPPPYQGMTEVLQKLHFLEMIVEQTNSELHLLEQMIQRGLAIK